jgi:hypothetical protein
MQARCFDSKIMAQPSVFTDNSIKFSDQDNICARSGAKAQQEAREVAMKVFSHANKQVEQEWPIKFHPHVLMSANSSVKADVLAAQCQSRIRRRSKSSVVQRRSGNF